MNYEQKYKEALERARVWRDKSGMPKDRQGVLDDIFPELRESEDERIRKELLEHCKKLTEMYNTLLTAEEYNKKQSWIAWLEKQGEQNLANSAKTCKEDEEIWNEKDEKMLSEIIDELNPCGEYSDCTSPEEQEYYYKRQAMVEWLKFLKEKLVVK